MTSSTDNAKDKMRVFIDCQLLQTSDRNRGMGLFLTSLLKALSETVDQETIEWVFVINTILPQLTREDINMLNSFKGSIVKKKFINHSGQPSFQEAAKANRSVIDQIVTDHAYQSTRKTIFFIPALFSNEIFPVFPTQDTINVLLFHDIIPYLYHKEYFRNQENPALKDYCQRFTEFYKTDLFVTNSQTTADDLNIYFGVDSSRVVPILGAGAKRSPQNIKPPSIAGQLKTDFILMPSGDDYRKNNAVAVQALSELNSKIKLVITSNFSVESQERLKQIYPNIIFTGIVSDSEYLWLTDNAKFVLFPSKYEGLGMPVLEAVDRKATVVCANIPVLVEISRDAFFYFDPESPTELAEKIKCIMDADSPKLITLKKERYPDIIERFSWPKTAEAFLKALLNTKPTRPKKSTVAILCPSPASYSAIGKYVFELHAELSRLFDISYFVEEGSTSFEPVRPNILKYASSYKSIAAFDENTARNYENIIYNVGNSEFHGATILHALRHSANAIIHDTKLNGIFDYMTNRKIITPERRQYEEILDINFGSEYGKCLSSIASNQHVVICHSACAENAIQIASAESDTRVIRLRLPTGIPQVAPLRSGSINISFAGIISESKGINLVAQVSKLDNIKVKVFGFGVLGDSPLLEEVRANVEILKDLTDKEFQDALKQSSIVVSYRVNYNGETSLSTLEAMSYGAVVVVNSVGWYSELPNNTVVKVDSEAAVVDVIKELISKPEKRNSIGEAARSYIAEEHTHLQYTKDLADNLESHK